MLRGHLEIRCRDLGNTLREQGNTLRGPWRRSVGTHQTCCGTLKPAVLTTESVEIGGGGKLMFGPSHPASRAIS